MLIEQDELIQQYGSERQELTASQAFDGHLAAPFKEILEQAVERFDRLRAQFVKDAPDFNSPIDVWIGSPARGDQFAVVTTTLDVQLGRVRAGRLLQPRVRRHRVALRPDLLSKRRPALEIRL